MEKKTKGGRGKRKAEEPAGPAEDKKVRKDESEMNDDELFEEHNRLVWEVKDKLKAALQEYKVPNNCLREILEHNGMSSKGGESDLYNKVVTGLVWGKPPSCPECNGSLHPDNGVFKCKSHANEWAHCTYETETATYLEFTLPDWTSETDFLKDHKWKPRRRVLKKEIITKASVTSETSSSSSTSNSQDEPLPFALGGPEVPDKSSSSSSSSSGANSIFAPSDVITSTPLKDLTFAFSGSKFSTSQKALGALVEELGGTVLSSVSAKCNILISYAEEAKSGSKKVSDAMEKHVPILSEDLLHKCKAEQKKLNFLQFWVAGTDEAKLSLSPAEAGNKQLRKEKEKDLYKMEATKVKLVKKGRGAVDPASGESIVRDYHVFDEKNILWDAMLTLADMTTGNNSYYALQLLQHDKLSNSFQLFRKWGRVGTTIGSNKLESFSSKQSAQQQFEELFKEKSGNDWIADQGNWKKYPKKFFPVEISYDFEDDDEKAKKLKAASSGDASGSKLPKEVQNLIKLIFNVEAMEQSLMEMELDLKKMPLGKLSKKHIQSGYEVLKKIETVLNNDALDERKRSNELLALNNQFFTIIPHDFGTDEPKMIKTLEALKAKIDMMEALIDIEIATSLMMDQSGSSSVGTSVLDQNYAKLKTTLDPVDHGSDEWEMAKTYLYNQKNHWNLELESVFRVEREGETARFETKKHLGNRQLLWHGSGKTNYVGILSQGLRIAPPEAPVSGYRFGKGVYFADLCDKSIGYCRGSRNDSILMMLCEVTLGKQKELFRDQYMEKPLPGSDSTKAMGRWIPDPSATKTIEDGIIVPMGKPYDSKVSSSCTHDELIIYDIAQVRIRYLLRILQK